MKSNWINNLWGAGLVLAGGLFLAHNVGLIPDVPGTLWKFIFTGLSLLFFATYFINGLRNWGWLFPACIFAGLALTVSLGEAGVDGAWVAAPLLLSVAVPFLVVFAFSPRQNWWALIPAWVMAVISLIVVVADRVPGEAIGALVLFSIALPFLIVFATNPAANKWALIPAFALMVVGIIPLLAAGPRPELIGAFVMFAIAMPFLVVFLWRRENWWAIIPAGVTASIGLVVLLAAGGSGFSDKSPGIYTGILLLGIAATFTVLWVRGGETRWAVYPAVGLALIALLAFVLGAGFDRLWPVLMIAGGLLLLYGSLRPRRAQLQ